MVAGGVGDLAAEVVLVSGVHLVAGEAEDRAREGVRHPGDAPARERTRHCADVGPREAGVDAHRVQLEQLAAEGITTGCAASVGL